MIWGGPCGRRGRGHGRAHSRLELERAPRDLAQLAARLPARLDRRRLLPGIEGAFLRDIAFPGQLQRGEPGALAGIEAARQRLRQLYQPLAPDRLLAPRAELLRARRARPGRSRTQAIATSPTQLRGVSLRLAQAGGELGPVGRERRAGRACGGCATSGGGRPGARSGRPEPAPRCATTSRGGPSARPPAAAAPAWPPGARTRSRTSAADAAGPRCVTGMLSQRCTPQPIDDVGHAETLAAPESCGPPDAPRGCRAAPPSWRSRPRSRLGPARVAVLAHQPPEGRRQRRLQLGRASSPASDRHRPAAPDPPPRSSRRRSAPRDSARCCWIPRCRPRHPPAPGSGRWGCLAR